MKKRKCLLLFALAAHACGSTDEPIHGGTEHDGHSGGEAASGGHAEHGHHGHHDHSDPHELEPLMRQLYASMQSLRGALADEDMSVATEQASAIASACDEQPDEAPDAEQFGARFLEIDRELHGAAAALAEATDASDFEVARGLYERTLAACGACHEQAPTAGSVDLSALAATW